MGRVLLYTFMALLGVFVFVTWTIIESGGSATEAAHEVSVHDLSFGSDIYGGSLVSTGGVLRFLTEPEDHFVVTDEGLGIVIRGYDEDELRRLRGRTVTVIGRFDFDEPNGVYIVPDLVTPRQ
jgi:hypothetical protein